MIRNCFRHANFIHKDPTNEEEHFSIESDRDERAEKQNEEFFNAWNELQIIGGIKAGNSMEDFMNVDDLVETCGALTLAEIVEDVTRTEAESEEEEIEEVQVEKPPINRLEAQRAFAIARQYVEENSGDPAMLRHTDAIDYYFYEERQNKQNQQKITSFFPFYL